MSVRLPTGPDATPQRVVQRVVATSSTDDDVATCYRA